jgi:methyl-accepting chemotaxis protein
VKHRRGGVADRGFVRHPGRDTGRIPILETAVSFFRALPIGRRLAAAFGLLLLLLVATAATGGWTLARTHANVHFVNTSVVPSLRVVAEVRRHLQDVRRIESQHMMATTAKEAQDFEQRIDRAHAGIRDALKSYGALVADDTDHANWQEVQKLTAAYEAIWPRMREASAKVRGDIGLLEDAKAILYGDARTAFNAAQKALDRFWEHNVQIADRAAQASTGDYRWALRMLAVLAAVSVALGVALAWLIARSVTVPLHEAMRVAQQVAEGDLSARLAPQGRDETARLAQALATMTGNLARVVGSVRGGTDAIATAASQIASGNDDLSRRTEAQASSLQQTAASMQQLTGTVRANTDAARQAVEMAGAASTAAAHGGQVVGQVVATMQDIAAGSRRVADIIGVIDGIAFQTNILALNAAVEAARAGDQGRGFAVVASEVRALAQRSADAAREIKTLIGASVGQVEAGTAQVEQAGAAMREIVAQVERVAGLIRRMGDATGEQQAGIEQIGGAVGQLDQATQQNAALVEQSAAAAQSLRQQAARLQEAVSVFRLGGASA